MARREGLYSMKTITKDPPNGTGPPSGMLPAGFQGSRLFTFTITCYLQSKQDI